MQVMMEKENAHIYYNKVTDMPGIVLEKLITYLMGTKLRKLKNILLL